MDDILMRLYHGAIHPEEEYQPTKAHKQALKKLDEQRQALFENLQEIDPKLCREAEELFETQNALEAMEMEEIYTQGMRMGARLALALLNKSEA